MTQREQIEKHLKRYGGITSMQAFNQYYVTRLSAVIFDLRKKGLNIENHWQKSPNGKMYVKYTLVK